MNACREEYLPDGVSGLVIFKSDGEVCGVRAPGEEVPELLLREPGVYVAHEEGVLYASWTQYGLLDESIRLLVESA